MKWNKHQRTEIPPPFVIQRNGDFHTYQEGSEGKENEREKRREWTKGEARE